jgi:phosphoribosylpyrophosphate synthetase
MPAFRDLPLEEGRRNFLKWIEAARPHGSAKNGVTVVFDGHPDHFGGASEGEIRVIFSDGCSADDTIKRMVEEDAERHNCVVVSDDKDIFLYARSLGARVMKVAAFIEKSKEVRGGKIQGEKYISLSRQENINKELYKIWLGKKQ